MTHPDLPGLFHGIYGLLRWPAHGRDEIVEFQNRALGRMVRHAYGRVPYYRGLFDGAGLTPAAVRTIDDLPKIPMTTRAIGDIPVSARDKFHAYVSHERWQAMQREPAAGGAAR